MWITLIINFKDNRGSKFIRKIHQSLFETGSTREAVASHLLRTILLSLLHFSLQLLVDTLFHLLSPLAILIASQSILCLVLFLVGQLAVFALRLRLLAPSALVGILLGLLAVHFLTFSFFDHRFFERFFSHLKVFGGGLGAPVLIRIARAWSGLFLQLLAFANRRFRRHTTGTAFTEESFLLRPAGLFFIGIMIAARIFVFRHAMLMLFALFGFRGFLAFFDFAAARDFTTRRLWNLFQPLSHALLHFTFLSFQPTFH